ncbi:mitochondrial chaperone ATPase [Colletotrichum tofieldiae]|uniref:Mitochondrial chaperone ATPase n=1 Tax=Colletotrichum tofieldiae TaxID=708197 RepID=A0A166SPQ3_9PEZI|nr:mitochondrial chaperone ATPase [Colletotrichum tofieldiae]
MSAHPNAKKRCRCEPAIEGYSVVPKPYALTALKKMGWFLYSVPAVKEEDPDVFEALRILPFPDKAKIKHPWAEDVLVTQEDMACRRTRRTVMATLPYEWLAWDPSENEYNGSVNNKLCGHEECVNDGQDGEATSTEKGTCIGEWPFWEISNDDSLYQAVLHWANNCKEFSGNHQIVGLDETPWLSRLRTEETETEEFFDRQLLHTPSVGTCRFSYSGKRGFLTRNVNRNVPGVRKEWITITTLGRDPTVLDELMTTIKTAYFDQDSHSVAVFRASCSPDPKWVLSARQSRDMSTIAMAAGLKQQITDDITNFRAPNQFKWYRRRGLPYRRGYLFHGPPGTGKTSLCVALATLCQLPIYNINISSSTLDDEILGTLFHLLPPKCMVLFEDIDSSETVQKRLRPPPRAQDPRQASWVTFSGLLNILDGTGAQEGRVLVMSTNHPKKIDPAFIRPGRVDMVIHFDLVDQLSAQLLFRSLVLEDSSTADNESATAAKETENKLIAEFVKNVPEGVVSHAELQGYLMATRQDPQAVVNGVSAWLKEKQESACERFENLAWYLSDTLKIQPPSCEYLKQCSLGILL